MSIKRLDGLTHDTVAERIEELGALFPEVFKDGKIDFDALQNALGEFSEDAREKYSFTWAGKTDAIRLAQKRSTGTLRPCVEESVNFDTTQNLYIEGDNLEVLKLLAGSYMNRVKMIYIDPPYNTGNDFVYPDDFSDSIENYKKLIDEGAKSNPETAGRYHTNWLNMMLPRLKLARTLLRQDGVIFISIDDNEIANLRKLCDEVFGEHNFVAQVTAQTNPRGRTFDKYIAKTHEYVLVYTKTDADGAMFEVPKSDAAIAGYGKEDEKGKYRLLELRNRNPVFNRSNRPNLYYPFYANESMTKVSTEKTSEYTIEILPLNSQGEDGCWTWGKAKAQAEIELLVPSRASTGSLRVFRKDYLEGSSLVTKSKSIWDDSSINHENGKETLGELFGKTPFDFPKSVEYLIKCLRIGTTRDNSDIVLDFFSGSGTLAHAVMQLNAEDGGNRRFICIQLPEAVDENTEAFKQGLKTICEIGKERIRRAGKRITELDKRRDMYIAAIKDVVKDKHLETSLYLFARETEKKYIENENDPEVDYDFVCKKLVEIINDCRQIDDETSVYEKYESLLEKPTSRLAHLLSGLTFGTDTGFKVFKLDSSNLRKWDNGYTRDYEQLSSRILDYYDYMVEGRRAIDLVYEIMLKYSLPLTLPVSEVTAAGATAHIISHAGDESVDAYKVLVCMQSDLSIEQIEALSGLGCGTLFFADRCFADTNAMTNCDEILKKAGQEMRLF